MAGTDPKDETSASTPETHDTSTSSSQADAPSQTESQQPEQPQESQESREPEAQPQQSAESETADATSESQPASSASASSSSSSPPANTPPDIEKARSFLRDPDVKAQSAARKAAYLAQKGYSQHDIDMMLKEVEEEEDEEYKQDQQDKDDAAAAAAMPMAPRPTATAATLPPIVTYPEFVANSSPQPPPPLVTPQVLARALYGTAATSSLLYAAARLVLAPMVDALNDARSELHETAGAKLATLTEKLEGVVSVVPAATLTTATKDVEAEVQVEDDIASDSSYDDPAEVFHRDIGVQTSLPPSPALPPAVTMDSTVPNHATGLPLATASSPPSPPKTPSQVQADRLSALAESVRALSQGWVGSTDVHADIKTTVEVFRDDVDKLTRPPAFTYGGGSGSGVMYSYGSAISGTGSTSGSKYPGYVTTTRNEPDDEIRKAKENIRRVKGALLSARTFPTAR